MVNIAYRISQIAYLPPVIDLHPLVAIFISAVADAASATVCMQAGSDARK